MEFFLLFSKPRLWRQNVTLFRRVTSCDLHEAHESLVYLGKTTKSDSGMSGFIDWRDLRGTY